jgi:hypothetical protein
LIPHGESGAELCAVARDDERAAVDERRLGTRLPADLLAVFLAALDITDGDLSGAMFLRLLERWPSADAIIAASRDEIVDLGRMAHHGWPERFPDPIAAALARNRLPVRSEPAPAKAGTIQLTPPGCSLRAPDAGRGNGG